MTYTVTMNVAGAGTPTSDGGSSVFGHMWYSLDNGSGIPADYGYAPKEDSNPLNDAWGPGEVFINDSTHYIADQAHPITTVTIELTLDQYNDMIAFGEAAKTSSDWETYNGAWNSCVDFVWAALKAAGLNPTGFQGDVFPTSNIDDLKKILSESIKLTAELKSAALAAIQAAAQAASQPPDPTPITPPITTYTIYGDLNPLLDILGGLQYDDWGNIISDGQAAPGRSDYIGGTTASDLIYAGGGNDSAWGKDGNDMILGGGGSDTLYGDYGTGGTGEDYIDGGDGNDSICKTHNMMFVYTGAVTNDDEWRVQA